MSRKDYIAFSNLLKTLRDADWISNNQLDRFSHEIGDIFSHDNFRFDRAKFLKACGVEQ